jgi:hypothetical protein
MFQLPIISFLLNFSYMLKLGFYHVLEIGLGVKIFCLLVARRVWLMFLLPTFIGMPDFTKYKELVYVYFANFCLSMIYLVFRKCWFMFLLPIFVLACFMLLFYM